MAPDFSLVIPSTDTDLTSTVNSVLKFSVEELFWTSKEYSYEQANQQILYAILRKPEQLIFHIRRIHTSYRAGFSEHLYAALIDLLLILDGKGKDLSVRMVLSTRSLLEKQQLTQLINYLKHQNSALPTHVFSLLSKGLIGTSALLTKNTGVDKTHDPLQIALDYIEYSDLDAAKETLESAVLEFPERQDIQIELLELYKVTKNIQAFTEMHKQLMEKDFNLSLKWQELVDYFAEQPHEE